MIQNLKYRKQQQRIHKTQQMKCENIDSKLQRKHVTKSYMPNLNMV